MIAYRLLQPQEPPQLQEVPTPSPGAGQLLITWPMHRIWAAVRA